MCFDIERVEKVGAIILKLTRSTFESVFVWLAAAAEAAQRGKSWDLLYIEISRRLEKRRELTYTWSTFRLIFSYSVTCLLHRAAAAKLPAGARFVGDILQEEASQGQLDLLKYAQTDVYNKVAYIRHLCSIRENKPHNFTDRMMTGQAKWQTCSRMAL